MAEKGPFHIFDWEGYLHTVDSRFWNETETFQRSTTMPRVNCGSKMELKTGSCNICPEVDQEGYIHTICGQFWATLQSFNDQPIMTSVCRSEPWTGLSLKLCLIWSTGLTEWWTWVCIWFNFTIAFFMHNFWVDWHDTKVGKLQFWLVITAPPPREEGTWAFQPKTTPTRCHSSSIKFCKLSMEG